MMRKTIPVVLALAVFSTGAFALAQDNAGEQGETTVRSTFPISELGNCASKEACKAYCDAEGHGAACLDYAAANSLMSTDEIARARTLMKEHEGPGGCIGTGACRAYCNEAAHRDECTRFATERGLTPPGGDKNEGERGNAQEAKIRAAIIKNGSGPGGCTSFTECRAYCEDAEHRNECVTFAEENGIGNPGPRGLERAAEQSGNPRVQQLLETNDGPGGCKSEGECKTYCEDPDHMDVCLKFAEENDLMPKDELERAKKMIGRIGPGGCRGQECKTYCEDEGHADECLTFAEENGMMSKDEAQKARTFMTKTGPGGCRGQECKRYCEDDSRRDECMQFAVENGLMSPEELQQVREMQTRSGPGGCKGPEECERYCSDPAHQDECKVFGERMNGQEGPRAFGEGGRFQGENPSGGFPPPGQRMKDGPEMAGPGGCKGPEECASYCAEHADECQKFRPQANESGQGASGQMPGKPLCNSPEECQSLCAENPERCANAGQNVRGRIQQMKSGGGTNVPAEMLKNMAPDKERMEKVREMMQKRGGESFENPGNSGSGNYPDPRGENGQFRGPSGRPVPPGPGREGIAPPIEVPGGELPFREGRPVPVGPGFDPSSPPVSPTPAPSTMPPQTPVPRVPTSMGIPSNFTASVYAIFSQLIGR